MATRSVASCSAARRSSSPTAHRSGASSTRRSSSDGGPPFASTGPARQTELSVWLLRLGIKVEIIAPGKPQQNRRLERLHRTLKAEVAAAPEANLRAQQRAGDLWRRAYNHERPHEALGQRRPASVYTPSSRTYPRPRVALTADPCSDVARVDKHGFVKWRQRRRFISSALKHEYVEFDPPMDGRWDVRWGGIPLGRFNEQRLDRGLVVDFSPRTGRRTCGARGAGARVFHASAWFSRSSSRAIRSIAVSRRSSAAAQCRRRMSAHPSVAATSSSSAARCRQLSRPTRSGPHSP